jgi:hypothetical protein
VATVTKAANAHAVVVTGWTNPSNAFAFVGDNVYATAAPAKNATVSGDFGFPDFTAADIPDGATINLVTVTVEWLVSNTTSATLGVQLRNNGVALGTETTYDSKTEIDSTQQVTAGITLTDLRSASTLIKARVRDTRGNTTTAHTGSLDLVSITVDYTSSGTVFTDSGSGTITASGSGTESLVYADNVTGSFAFTGSGVENFQPPSVTYTDSGSGTITLSGSGNESSSVADSGSGTLALSGSGSESFSAPIVYTDAGGGALTLSGSGIESFTPGSTTYTDAGSGTIALSGSSTEAHAEVGTGSGTMALSGALQDALVFSDLDSGTITLGGSASESFTGPTTYADSATGTLTLSGTKSEAYSSDSPSYPPRLGPAPLIAYLLAPSIARFP